MTGIFIRERREIVGFRDTEETNTEKKAMGDCGGEVMTKNSKDWQESLEDSK